MGFRVRPTVSLEAVASTVAKNQSLEDCDTGGIGGTLAGNALSLAAMRATLSKVLTEERVGVLGRRLGQFSRRGERERVAVKRSANAASVGGSSRLSFFAARAGHGLSETVGRTRNPTRDRPLPKMEIWQGRDLPPRVYPPRQAQIVCVCIK